jgi:hypothetical protein
MVKLKVMVKVKAKEKAGNLMLLKKIIDGE